MNEGLRPDRIAFHVPKSIKVAHVPDPRPQLTVPEGEHVLAFVLEFDQGSPEAICFLRADAPTIIDSLERMLRRLGTDRAPDRPHTG